MDANEEAQPGRGAEMGGGLTRRSSEVVEAARPPRKSFRMVLALLSVSGVDLAVAPCLSRARPLRRATRVRSTRHVDPSMSCGDSSMMVWAEAASTERKANLKLISSPRSFTTISLGEYLAKNDSRVAFVVWRQRPLR